jgi:hypothetical protein
MTALRVFPGDASEMQQEFTPVAPPSEFALSAVKGPAIFFPSENNPVEVLNCGGIRSKRLAGG